MLKCELTSIAMNARRLKCCVALALRSLSWFQNLLVLRLDPLDEVMVMNPFREFQLGELSFAAKNSSVSGIFPFPKKSKT